MKATIVFERFCVVARFSWIMENMVCFSHSLCARPVKVKAARKWLEINKKKAMKEKSKEKNSPPDWIESALHAVYLIHTMIKRTAHTRQWGFVGQLVIKIIITLPPPLHMICTFCVDPLQRSISDYFIDSHVAHTHTHPLSHASFSVFVVYFATSHHLTRRNAKDQMPTQLQRHTLNSQHARKSPIHLHTRVSI